MKRPPKPTWRQCSDPGCPAPHLARGVCAKHYQRARRAGALPPLSTQSRQDTVQLALRVSGKTMQALQTEALYTQTSVYATACRWMDAHAAEPKGNWGRR